MKQQSIEQQLAAMWQPTADLARMAQLHSRPNSDPEELQELCNLWLNPITEHQDTSTVRTSLVMSSASTSNVM